jgi:hypothetical protein
VVPVAVLLLVQVQVESGRGGPVAACRPFPGCRPHDSLSVVCHALAGAAVPVLAVTPVRLGELALTVMLA